MAQTKPAADPVPQMEQALAKNPNDPKVNIALGVAYLERGENARALERLQHAVKVAPDSAEAHNWLGVALLDRADFPQGHSGAAEGDRARPEIRAGVREPRLGARKERRARRGRGRYSGRPSRSSPRALPRTSTWAWLCAKRVTSRPLCITCVASSRPMPAMRPCTTSSDRHCDRAASSAGAIAEFERALAINPELREGYYALGAALKQQSATARRPAPPPSSPADEAVGRAKAAAARSDLKTAGDALADALKRDPNHAEAHTLQGYVLGQQGNLSAALPHLQRATILRPESAEIRHNLGAALWYSGAREKAIAELRESVRLDPGSAGGHAFLGMALLETGDLRQCPREPAARDGAVTRDGGRLRRSRRRLPAGGESGKGSWAARSRAERSLAGAADAILGCRPSPRFGRRSRRVVSIRSTSEAHNVLGLVLGREGAPADEVVAAFRAAICICLDYAEAHNNLGYLTIQSGNDDEGIAALREAVRIAPAYAEARTNLGPALMPTDVEAAVKELEERSGRRPDRRRPSSTLRWRTGQAPLTGPGRKSSTSRR